MKMSNREANEKTPDKVDVSPYMIDFYKRRRSSTKAQQPTLKSYLNHKKSKS